MEKKGYEEITSSASPWPSTQSPIASPFQHVDEDKHN